MAERRGAAPAGPRQSDDALQKTRQQTRLFSPRKRPKTMQNDLRSSLLAPFRADRATAASDIVHHVADDDLRRSSAAAARKMSVYVWSAFLAGTRFRAKIAPWVARFGRDPPSHHGVRARGLVAEIGAPEAAQCPPGTTFPAWPFLGPAAIVCGRLFGAQASRAKWSSPTTSGPTSAAPPRGRCSANSSKSASVNSLLSSFSLCRSRTRRRGPLQTRAAALPS